MLLVVQCAREEEERVDIWTNFKRIATKKENSFFYAEEGHKDASMQLKVQMSTLYSRVVQRESARRSIEPVYG